MRPTSNESGSVSWKITPMVLRICAVLSLAVLIVTPAVAQVGFVDASGSFTPPFVHSAPTGDGLAGAAWLDFDRDGFLDLFLTNGQGNNNALYRNNGAGGFTDVAVAAGVANGLGNAAVVAADLDNDGDQDLFLTGDGGMMGIGDSPVRLFRNNLFPTGIANFTDVTAASGIVPPPSHMDATFGDIDNDGFLDLFIGASGSFCPGGQTMNCTPGNHNNQLYRNTFAATGTLSFRDITAGSGVGTALGACTAFFGHYDNDNFIDLFVGNCNGLALPWPVTAIAAPNELFRNNGNNTFTNVANAANGFSTPGFWMGFGQADFNNDLLVDIFTTNFSTGLPIPAPHAFWAKLGSLNPVPPPTYVDVAGLVGVAGLEFGWGATAQDFDADGFADLYFAGALPQFGIIGPPLANPGRMLLNQLGSGVIPFNDITATLPASANLSNRFSSGVASADYDNDGDVDIVVQTDVLGGGNGAPLLLNNQGNDANNTLTVCVQGTSVNRDGVGARIGVGTATSSLQLRRSTQATATCRWIASGRPSGSDRRRSPPPWQCGGPMAWSRSSPTPRPISRFVWSRGPAPCNSAAEAGSGPPPLAKGELEGDSLRTRTVRKAENSPSKPDLYSISWAASRYSRYP